MKKMMILFVTALNLLISDQISFAQQDTTEEKPTQYRRGIELEGNYQGYEEKYAGKNLNEVKRSLFPLRAGTGVWTELNPKVPRVDYLGIHFVNPDTGWVVGDLGALVKTTNGGDDWTIAETQTTTLLIKVHSYDGQTVIATGYDGLILRSTDGGETFEQVASGVGSGIDLWGLYMLNDTLGFACGLNQTLLKTTDAGLTWQQVNAGLNAHYWAIDFYNKQFGMIACSDGKILKTTDGGLIWTEHQAGDASDLFALDIVDSLHIAAAGLNGKNVYSSDGGISWIQNNRLQHDELNSIKFISTDTGYTVGIYTGESWGIRKTTNRGVSWFSPPIQNLSEWELELLTDGVGYSAGSSLWIMKTTEDYDNWENLFFNIDLADVYFTNELTGYIAGGTWTGGPVYKTTDGGLSWFGLPNFPTGLFTSTLTTLIFTDSVTGFASGTNTTIKTTDAGESWYEPTGLPGGISKFFFLNKNTGWGTSGKNILKTTDGGENWTIQFTVPNGSFSSINFIDSLYGWASIINRRPYKTIDGGNNWIEQTNFIYFQTRDVYFVNHEVGWIITGSGGNNLLKTTDSGGTWNSDTSVVGSFRFHFFPDPVHWLINGSRRYVTEDDGNTFIEITNDVPTGFGSFEAVNDKLGYAVGNFGLILRYDDTSYVPVELISFDGRIVDDKIILLWQTASELNNQGFYIEKSYNKINWEAIGFINGNGTTTETNYYNFTDKKVFNGENSYRLKQIDFDGSFNYSEIVTIYFDNLPQNFELFQNFPNPFNPKTSIKYSMPKKDFVNIALYSILGDKITDLVNEEKQAGIHTIILSANGLASGIYLYEMRTGSGYSAVKKLAIIK